MERTEMIKRYENIKLRWDNNKDLKRILPEVYEDICRKLEGLKQGAEYTIKDKTSELKQAIAFVGGQIPRCNFKGTKEGDKVINRSNGITWEESKKVADMF